MGPMTPEEDLEKLRMLKEHEMGVRVEKEEGSLYGRPVGEG